MRASLHYCTRSNGISLTLSPPFINLVLASWSGDTDVSAPSRASVRPLERTRTAASVAVARKPMHGHSNSGAHVRVLLLLLSS
jgi:hypothetical protein